MPFRSIREVFFGRFGESAMETSYRLLRHHLVSVVASDAHSAVERTPFFDGCV